MNVNAVLENLGWILQSEVASPDVVRLLSSAGVDSYDVDLINKRMVFYYDGGDMNLPFGIEDLPPVGERFDAGAVAQAVKRNQGREIDYAGFIRGIMSAGVRCYTVEINNGRVIYSGVDGQDYTEVFPPV